MSRRRSGIGSLLSFTPAAGGLLHPEQHPGGSTGGSTGASPSAETPESLTVLCTPQEDWCQVMVARFEEEFGVDTNYIRLSSGEALARLQAGASAPEFSVWWGGPADGFVAAGAEGLLEAVRLAERGPDRRGPEGCRRRLDRGLRRRARVLLEHDDPRGAGRRGSDLVGRPARPEAQGPGGDCAPGQLRHCLHGVLHPGHPHGRRGPGHRVHGELHPNILQYTSSGAAPAEMAGRGEVAVSVVFSHDCVRNIDAGFTDLEVTFPEEGTGYEIGGVGLIANAPEPNAAKAWIDWSLEASTQEIGAAEAALLPAPDEPRRGGRRAIGQPRGGHAGRVRLPGGRRSAS